MESWQSTSDLTEQPYRITVLCVCKSIKRLQEIYTEIAIIAGGHFRAIPDMSADIMLFTYN